MKKESSSLLSWYHNSNYSLPWRQHNNAYAVWISEIMLQQTKVDTVRPYFNNWMNCYPSIQDLANANIDEILKLWEGLGYYRRAHYIFEASKILVTKHKGNIPNNYDELIAIKGIGDYTASAILSIVFNKPYPAIDGNLKRVLSRLYTIKQSPVFNQSIKKMILKYMQNNTPGDINQAFMDLGREICTPQNPKCNLCPLMFSCKAYKSKTISNFPKKKIKNKRPFYNVVVAMIYKKNKFLISKRKINGLLGGLWELPGGKKENKESNRECLHREIKEELNIDIEIGNKIGEIKHQYSHFKINLIGYFCLYKKGAPFPVASDELKWIMKKNIKEFAFPRSTIKLFNLIEDK